MPIYAYRCESCGHAKDVLQKVSDPLLTVCPICGAEAFRKQLTAAGFQLKGSGWYVTDFKGGAQASKPAPSREADAAKPAADAAVGAASEGKPAPGAPGPKSDAPVATPAAPPAGGPAPSAQ